MVPSHIPLDARLPPITDEEKLPCAPRDVELVTILIKAGAEACPYSHTPHVQHHPPVLTRCCGTQASSLGEDGFAPIHRAAWGEENGHMEVVELLIKHGVSPRLLSAPSHLELRIPADP